MNENPTSSPLRGLLLVRNLSSACARVGGHWFIHHQDLLSIYFVPDKVPEVKKLTPSAKELLSQDHFRGYFKVGRLVAARWAWGCGGEGTSAWGKGRESCTVSLIKLSPAEQAGEERRFRRLLHVPWELVAGPAWDSLGWEKPDLPPPASSRL